MFWGLEHLWGGGGGGGGGSLQLGAWQVYCHCPAYLMEHIGVHATGALDTA